MHRIGSKNRERRVAIIKFELKKENCLGLFFLLKRLFFSFFSPFSYVLSRSYIYLTTRPPTSQSFLVCHCTYVCIPPFPPPFRPPHPRRIARQKDSIPFFGGGRGMISFKSMRESLREPHFVPFFLLYIEYLPIRNILNPSKKNSLWAKARLA